MSSTSSSSAMRRRKLIPDGRLMIVSSIHNQNHSNSSNTTVVAAGEKPYMLPYPVSIYPQKSLLLSSRSATPTKRSTAIQSRKLIQPLSSASVEGTKSIPIKQLLPHAEDLCANIATAITKNSSSSNNNNNVETMSTTHNSYGRNHTQNSLNSTVGGASRMMESRFLFNESFHSPQDKSFPKVSAQLMKSQESQKQQQSPSSSLQSQDTANPNLNKQYILHLEKSIDSVGKKKNRIYIKPRGIPVTQQQQYWNHFNNTRQLPTTPTSDKFKTNINFFDASIQRSHTFESPPARMVPLTPTEISFVTPITTTTTPGAGTRSPKTAATTTMNTRRRVILSHENRQQSQDTKSQKSEQHQLQNNIRRPSKMKGNNQPPQQQLQQQYQQHHLLTDPSAKIEISPWESSTHQNSRNGLGEIDLFSIGDENPRTNTGKRRSDGNRREQEKLQKARQQEQSSSFMESPECSPVLKSLNLKGEQVVKHNHGNYSKSTAVSPVVETNKAQKQSEMSIMAMTPVKVTPKRVKIARMTTPAKNTKQSEMNKTQIVIQGSIQKCAYLPCLPAVLQAFRNLEFFRNQLKRTLIAVMQQKQQNDKTQQSAAEVMNGIFEKIENQQVVTLGNEPFLCYLKELSAGKKMIPSIVEAIIDEFIAASALSQAEDSEAQSPDLAGTIAAIAAATGDCFANDGTNGSSAGGLLSLSDEIAMEEEYNVCLNGSGVGNTEMFAGFVSLVRIQHACEECGLIEQQQHGDGYELKEVLNVPVFGVTSDEVIATGRFHADVCAKCKESRLFQQQVSFIKAPEVLCVTVKRDALGGGSGQTKIEKLPTEFRVVERLTSKQVVFELAVEIERVLSYSEYYTVCKKREMAVGTVAVNGDEANESRQAKILGYYDNTCHVTELKQFPLMQPEILFYERRNESVRYQQIPLLFDKEFEL